MAVDNQILYLLSKNDKIIGKEILEIIGSQGYSAQFIRNTLSKLKRDEYISSKERGLYLITDKGRKSSKLSRVTTNYYHQKWDGKWLVVLTEIPESNRNKRDIFRHRMYQLGFGHLYNSVYLYPWDISDRVLKIIKYLELEDFITMIRTEEFLFNPVTADGHLGTNKANVIWHLDEINEQYINMKSWLDQEYQTILDQLIQKSKDHYIYLFHEYMKLKAYKNDLLHIDPMLPPEFLPVSWQGTNVLEQLEFSIQMIAKKLNKSSFSVYLDDEDM